MNEIESVIARRLAFLEREFDRMGRTADDAEEELRFNPTNPAARRRLEAIYVVAGQIWNQIRELRARQNGHDTVIRYDRNADNSVQRAYRQALG